MLKYIVLILSFVAAFFVFQWLFDSKEKRESFDSFDQALASIEVEARQNYPDEPAQIALQKAAVERAQNQIKSKTTRKEKIETAAGSFFGFYWVNYRQRAQYCGAKGVDISPFTREFKSAHKDVYALALSALSAGQSEIDRMYNLIEPQLENAVDADMQFVANEYNLTIAQACQMLADNAQATVAQMHLSKLMPLVYETLVEPR